MPTILLRCPNDQGHGILPYALLCVHLLRGKPSRDWYELGHDPTDIRECAGDWLCTGCAGVARRQGYHYLINAGRIEAVCFRCVESLKRQAGFVLDECGNWVKP